jgi:hypothetical protein
MPVYTSTSPAALEVLSASQPLIQQNFAYLALDIGTDHNFLGNSGTPTDGYHKTIHFVDRGASNPPPTVAGVGQIYTNTITADQQLFYKSGNGVITQLTGPSAPVTGGAASNGYMYLPGGVLMQWANITPSNSSSTPYTFVGLGLIAYPTAVFGITGCCSGPAVAVGSGSVVISNITTSGFSAKQNSGSGQQVFIIALGN